MNRRDIITIPILTAILTVLVAADETALKLYFYSIAVTTFLIALEITRMTVKVRRQAVLRLQGRSDVDDE